MSLSSLTGDDVVEVMLVAARCRCRVLLTMALSSYANDAICTCKTNKLMHIAATCIQDCRHLVFLLPVA
jgi:hypothetical protein